MTNAETGWEASVLCRLERVFIRPAHRRRPLITLITRRDGWFSRAVMREVFGVPLPIAALEGLVPDKAKAREECGIRLGSPLKTLKTLKRFPVRLVRVFSGSGGNGPLFRDVQDRIDELADVLKAGNGVEASAGRVADEELGHPRRRLPYGCRAPRPPQC